MRILRQQDAMDCGLACLLTISRHYKKILTMMNYEHSAILGKVVSPFWASVKLLRK